MQPVTYLCFTLLSILIQFCLMDFINERIQSDDTFIDHKRTLAKNLSFILKKINEKPHALYYQNDSVMTKMNESPNKKYNNYSLPVSIFQTTTEFTSTLFDFVYDENISMSESALTTETYYNDSEYDNVTEITFFDKKMTTKPIEVPKKRDGINNCGCNVLFNKCDINCCCDNECSDSERNLFTNCKGEYRETCSNYDRKFQHYCFFQDTCSGDLANNIFDRIFCIDKVNLPDKRVNYFNKIKNYEINKYFKWHTIYDVTPVYKFTRNIYLYGQPIWFLKNEDLHIISLPITASNNYCKGKKPIKFLKNEHIKCFVKTKDLHFLYAARVSVDSNVVSPTEMTTNSTTMNCSSLYCINWTVLTCNDYDCTKYNKSIHVPSCSERHCNNIGVKIEYIFYCNESVITNATLKMYVKQISTDIEYVSQELKVYFYMGNGSIEDTVKYSGNPGYIMKLPVIASFFESNHTKYFYNRTHENSNNLLFPYNQNGICLITNITNNIVKFGVNARTKCRLIIGKKYAYHNKTDLCLKIQMEVIKFLRFNSDIFISPYGNPNDMSDNKWIELQKFNKSIIYSEFNSKTSKLQCNNLITRFGYIFTYTDINDVKKGENQILNAIIDVSTRNVTFNIKDLSVVITVDTKFIDVSSQSMYGYVEAAPNTHLTKNVFFPFRNNSCRCNKYNLFLYLCTLLFLSK